MNDIKGLLQSRGIIGAIVALISGLLNVFGVASPDAAMQGEAVDIIVQLGAVGGSILAFWGRLVATKRIKLGGA